MGAATTLGGTAALMFGAPATAGELTPPERCIDELNEASNATSDDWDLGGWNAFFESTNCMADFGQGKIIVDVVDEDGVPVPGNVDLDSIVDAFDFGYEDPVRDGNKARLDPYCQLLWVDGFGMFSRDELEFFVDDNAWIDFRMDEDVAGRRVRVLQLLGDRDNLSGPGATEFALEANELLFSWACNGDTDQLRMLGVDDVGGGYRLLAGVNESFTGFEVGQSLSPVTRIQVVVSQIPEETTTTTAAPTTTMAPTTTTTVAPTTTQPAAQPVVPTTTTTTTMVPIAPVLPATGDSNGQLATLAALLAALGAGALLVSRRRTT